MQQMDHHQVRVVVIHLVLKLAEQGLLVDHVS